MRRRVVALTVPVVGLLAFPRAAGADEAPPARRVDWSPFRDEEGRRVEADHLAGTVRISAQVTDPGGLWGWAVDVDAAPGAAHPGFGRICEARLRSETGRAEVRCSWDTSRIDGGAGSANQGYVVRISVDDDDAGGPPADDTRPVIVSNPASAPRDVQAERSPEPGSRAVHVTWTPPPEPDIAGYVVARRRDGGNWEPVAEPDRPSHDEHDLDPGRYVFRVGARRRDAPTAAPQYWGTSEVVLIPDPSARRERPARPRRRVHDSGGPPPAAADPPPTDNGAAEGGSPPPAQTGDEPKPPPSPPGPPSSPSPSSPSRSQQSSSQQSSSPSSSPPSSRPSTASHVPESFPPAPSPPAAIRPELSTTWTLAIPDPPARLRRSPLRTAVPAPPPEPPPAAAAPAEPAPAEEPDSGYALSLPYPTPSTPDPPPPAPSARPRRPPPEERRRMLASLAIGQLCFVLAAHGRVLVHRASGHRLARPLPRSLRRCPRCGFQPKRPET